MSGPGVMADVREVKVVELDRHTLARATRSVTRWGALSPSTVTIVPIAPSSTGAIILEDQKAITKLADLCDWALEGTEEGVVSDPPVAPTPR